MIKNIPDLFCLNDVKNNKHQAIILFGPTASGKTNLSLYIADQIGFDKSIIINADSQQIYKGLPILTACPEVVEYQRVAHKLFEFLEPHEDLSVGRWIALARDEMLAAWKNGVTPIIVGGTGLYLKTLIMGLSKIPPIALKIQQETEEKFQALGVQGLYEALIKVDPLCKDAIDYQNPKRVIRAYNVFQQTGVSHTILKENMISVFDGYDIEPQLHYLQIVPDRTWLYDRCNCRFDKMIEAGAINEVKHFKQRYNQAGEAFAANVIGYDEINAFSMGLITRDGALEKASQRTRKYAKRQLTWARQQMKREILSPNVKSWQSVTADNLMQMT